MKKTRLVAVGAFTAAVIAISVLPVAGQAHANKSSSAGTAVSVRVEGMTSTLLAVTVDAKSSTIDKNGNPADKCEGDTVAAALQDATKGHWTAGTYDAGLGYPVVGILGTAYPFTSDYYWSFWVDGKPATTGICTAKLHAGEHILFFPQCSQEAASSCPEGLFNPPVLKLTGPAAARTGKPVVLSVSSLENLTGKATAGVGVKLNVDGKTVETGSAGKATIRFAHAGNYRIVATAPNSIRDELILRVSG